MPREQPNISWPDGPHPAGPPPPDFPAASAAESQLAQRRAFGANLRALRKEVGVSQERLAQLANMDRAYVGHVENGRRNISLHAMWQLAAALRVSPALFFRQPSGAEEGQ
ncbi:helix-turn-helix domain-containing protein [Cellulomonas sp. 179-A 4D5 NHS]|uniref:helix-turn-helix domain-containing protein n=1 Tax=Cellulomonas sp. 179-A 4D5 NHS TaxID=3142378 RepID=UPI0039A1DF3F